MIEALIAFSAIVLMVVWGRDTNSYVPSLPKFLRRVRKGWDQHKKDMGLE